MLSQLYYYRRDSLASLEKQYVLLCERKLCAALLLERLYDYAWLAEQRSMGLEDEYHDPAIYNTSAGLAVWFLDIFTVEEIEEALSYLADKGFITIWHARGQGDLKIECDIQKVDEKSRDFTYQRIPIHSPQYCQGEKQEVGRQTITLPPKAKNFEKETPAEREAGKVKYHNSRARNVHLPATLTLEQWLATLDYFGWKCAYCGSKYSYLEHFIPLNHGSGTTWDNCVPACGSCNNIKQAWHPLMNWGPELATIREGIERVQVYLATRSA